jgi:cellulose synthase/poly-beta-1,6-N-acetylglucosamine synthase-like glycosyltransferase
MVLGLFWLCCVLLVYIYILYPLFVRILAKQFGSPVLRGSASPAVTIIVTAYNEQACIRSKLDNLSALNYPAELVDILVVSDGSSDATEEIAATYNPARVRVLRVEGRRGKTACQNAAATAAAAEILVFTDATTQVHSDALRSLVENFADPSVGCVGGCLQYISDFKNMTGHGGEAYWSYEMRLRANESLLSSMTGVSGCLYAVRRSAYRAMEPDLISDFVIAMKMAEQGLRTVLAPDAVCLETTLSSSGHELAMRVRVVVRSLNALIRGRRFLNPFAYPCFAWQLWSHKVLRYASPLLWLCMLAANIILASQTPYYLIPLAAQCVLIAAGTAGFLLQGSQRNLGILGRPYYLLLTNAASLIATLRYLRGERMVIWTPIR